jgi:hypothetical protein
MSVIVIEHVSAPIRRFSRDCREQPCGGDRGEGRDIPVIRAGTRARAASTAPHGTAAATSRWRPGDGITETRYVPTLKMITANSSCSARLALRQVQITRARPNRAWDAP